MKKFECEYFVVCDFKDGNFIVIFVFEFFIIIINDVVVKIYCDGKVKLEDFFSLEVRFFEEFLV